MPDYDALERRIATLERWRLTLTTPGSWTPTFVGSGTAGTFTYAAQEGAYSRLGALVFVRARVAISAISVAPVGTMSIGGLPFTVGATQNSGVMFSTISQFNYSAGALQLLGSFSGGATTISLRESFDNAAQVNVPAANFTNVDCDLRFSAFYRAG